MKTPIVLSMLFALPILSQAEFEAWTNKDGKTTELELIGKIQKDGQLAGKFRMRDGRVTTVLATEFDTAGKIQIGVAPDAPAETSAGTTAARSASATPSAFDKILDGNLVKLSGDSVQKADGVAKPSKYYVFYYSASWCGPCQAYTPRLVALYNKIKPGNDTFELVFISNDENERSQEAYMKSKKMPWPALKFSQVKTFEKEFDHGVQGIPSVIICDLEGKIVSREESTIALEKLLGK